MKNKETLEEVYLNKLIDEANKEFTLDRKLAKDVAIKFAKWQQKEFLKFIWNEDYHTEGESGNSCIDVQTLVNFVKQLNS
jgi:hypothetical protein